jgi:hypothetical protein
MRQYLLRIALTLALCALLASAALAGGRSKTVTFDQDMTVGGTLLKRGTYKVTFDDRTNELTFKRGGKVVAKAAAHLAAYTGNSRNPPLYSARREGDAGPRLLTSVNVGGANAVIGESGAAAPANPAQ